MQRYGKIVCLVGLAVIFSGCQSRLLKSRYYNRIDDISDSKLAIERIYQPGLDVSRVGMPDWRQYGWNHKLHECNCHICKSQCDPVEYPAFYTLRYYAEQGKAADNYEDSMNNFEPKPITDLPLPEPPSNTEQAPRTEEKPVPPAK